MVHHEKFYRYLDPIDGFNGFLGKSIRENISDFQPDLVHFSAQYPAGSFHREEGGPLVTAALDATRVNMEKQTGGDFWNEKDFSSEGRLLNSLDHLFPWSQWAAQSMIDDYDVPESKIDVIFPSLDPAAIGARDNREVGEKPRVLFIGNDFVRKGGDKLVRWVTGPLAGTCELHIVSGDPRAEQYKGPNVVVHGGVPHKRLMHEVLPSMDMLCHPTKADMSAYVVVEAAFAGLPAVTSAIGGIPELVDHDRTGWALPPDDENAFIETMRMLFADPARIAKAGRMAHERAHANFDAIANYNRLFDVQLAMIERRASANAEVAAASRRQSN